MICILAHMRIHAHEAISGQQGLIRLRRIGKALADTSRLRILAALAEQELCVCHLIPMLGLNASTVSRHVGVLRDAGLVAVRKDGRWLHCSRAEPDAAIWTGIDEHLRGAPEVAVDRRCLSAGDATSGSGSECC